MSSAAAASAAIEAPRFEAFDMVGFQRALLAARANKDDVEAKRLTGELYEHIKRQAAIEQKQHLLVQHQERLQTLQPPPPPSSPSPPSPPASTYLQELKTPGAPAMLCSPKFATPSTSRWGLATPLTTPLTTPTAKTTTTTTTQDKEPFNFHEFTEPEQTAVVQHAVHMARVQGDKGISWAPSSEIVASILVQQRLEPAAAAATTDFHQMSVAQQREAVESAARAAQQAQMAPLASPTYHSTPQYLATPNLFQQQQLQQPAYEGAEYDDDDDDATRSRATTPFSHKSSSSSASKKKKTPRFPSCHQCKSVPKQDTLDDEGNVISTAFLPLYYCRRRRIQEKANGKRQYKYAHRWKYCLGCLSKYKRIPGACVDLPPEHIAPGPFDVNDPLLLPWDCPGCDPNNQVIKCMCRACTRRNGVHLPCSDGRERSYTKSTLQTNQRSVSTNGSRPVKRKRKLTSKPKQPRKKSKHQAEDESEDEEEEDGDDYDEESDGGGEVRTHGRRTPAPISSGSRSSSAYREKEECTPYQQYQQAQMAAHPHAHRSELFTPSGAVDAPLFTPLAAPPGLPTPGNMFLFSPGGQQQQQPDQQQQQQQFSLFTPAFSSNGCFMTPMTKPSSAAPYFEAFTAEKVQQVPTLFKPVLTMDEEQQQQQQQHKQQESMTLFSPRVSRQLFTPAAFQAPFTPHKNFTMGLMTPSMTLPTPGFQALRTPGFPNLFTPRV